MSTDEREGSENRRRRQVWIPSVYRYLALGSILPAMVFLGMIVGYRYGQSFGEFQAALLAAAGSMAGLVLSTVIIVKVGLAWDKEIQRSMERSRSKQRRHARKKLD